MNSSLALTSAMESKELAELKNISYMSVPYNPSMVYLVWNGSSVSQNETATRSLVDIMEESFLNATISSMSEASLKYILLTAQFSALKTNISNY